MSVGLLFVFVIAAGVHDVALQAGEGGKGLGSAWKRGEGGREGGSVREINNAHIMLCWENVANITYTSTQKYSLFLSCLRQHHVPFPSCCTGANETGNGKVYSTRCCL